MKCSKNTLKFAAVSMTDWQYYALPDNGTIIYADGAPLIRLLSERLRMCYKVVSPPDNAYGAELSDGSWSGTIGMVKRSEADIAVNLVQTEVRSHAVDFSYPYYQSTLGFMTDRPEPTFMSMAICRPFTHSVWIILMLTLCTVTLLMYILMKRKQKCQKVALIAFTILLQQTVSIRMRKSSLKMLVLIWMISTMIITNGYKAVLLSFLNVPTMIGISSISDLSKAVSTNSIQCFTFAGSYLYDIFSKSDEVSLQDIGECLNLNEKHSGEPDEFFAKAPRKKVFIGGKVYLMQYDTEYRISEDSFQDIMYAFALSKSFCCQEYLNTLIGRLNAAGLIHKIFQEEEFYTKFMGNKTQPDLSERIGKIMLKDLSGAFYLLVSGWVLSLVALLGEKIMVKLKV